MKKLNFLALVLWISIPSIAQTGTTKQEKKIITIEKKTDKDGNEIIEKKILEGDAVKKDKDWDDKEGRSVKITKDSMGNKTKIILNEKIKIETDESDDRDINNSRSGAGYTERTVTIKKNADGSIEIKELSGEDATNRFNLKVDSSEAKKPNIGVSLNDDMRILSVIQGGAAETGGLVKEDMLTHFDGTFIEDYDHLKELLAKKKVGDKVTITYLRDRKEMKASITLKGGNTRVYFNR